jgi:Leucine Rich repeat
MDDINILDLVSSDIFCEIQKYLGLKDLFSLRAACKDIKFYIDNELRKCKKLILPNRGERVKSPFKVLSENCSNLNTINLSRNQWIDDEMLMPLLEKNARTLESLNLSDCSNLTSVALQPVIINCSRLKKLNLHNCFFLTVGCLEAIAFHQTNIQELDLSNCIMGERTLVVLLSSQWRLHVLSLASVITVNDNVLFSISKYQTEIVHLNLFACNRITDRGIGALSLNCKKLETLSIRGCKNLSERSLNLLRSRHVHIDVPRNPTNAFINQFQRFGNVMYLQV